MEVKYAVPRFCRADFQAANNPAICDSGRSAPECLIYPEGIGVAAAILAARSKSQAARIVRAPVVSTAGLRLWNVIKLPTPDIGLFSLLTM